MPNVFTANHNTKLNVRIHTHLLSLSLSLSLSQTGIHTDSDEVAVSSPDQTAAPVSALTSEHFRLGPLSNAPVSDDAEIQKASSPNR